MVGLLSHTLVPSLPPLKSLEVPWKSLEVPWKSWVMRVPLKVVGVPLKSLEVASRVALMSSVLVSEWSKVALSWRHGALVVLVPWTALFALVALMTCVVPCVATEVAL